MAYRLTLHLPDGPQRAVLEPGENILGSTGDCDIQARHMTISRQHARLRVCEDELWIEDLGSSNGTCVESRRLRQAQRLEVPCRLSFGGVRAELEQVDAGDLESAVRIPCETQAPAALQDKARGLGGDAAEAFLEPSDTAGATLSSSALEELSLRRLPLLIEDLAAGSSPQEAAQRVGADLFHGLPCFELEIWQQAPSGKAVWFNARSEITPRASRGEIVESADGLHVRACFVQAQLGRQLAPLVRIGLQLIRWVVASQSVVRQPQALANPGRRPAASARAALPSPPTVDLRMQRIYTRAERVAGSDIGVLICGESGTGKEVMARFLHRASERADSRFVAINCAALPRDLLEVELFGIEHAVATGVDARPGKFELAHDGTLFLDEIGDMALETQAKILRVLQEGEVFRVGGREPRAARPRILAATHRDVEVMIRDGDFRRDLYYRLSGWVVQLPPLRERVADIPNLAAKFLVDAAAAGHRNIPGISVAAMDILIAYHWPGNIRELRHEISRAALFLDDGELLDSTCLSAVVRSAATVHSWTLKERLEAFERAEILRALERADGDVARAATALGIGRSTIYRRMKVLGVEEV